MRPVPRALFLSLLSLAMPGLEVSTGFLIGPRHDPRALYFRQQPGSVWRKSQAGRASASLGFRRILLQTAESSCFLTDGALKPESFARLDALLREAAGNSVAVELVLFHPGQDQSFDSSASMERAIDLVTDWLIDRDHRHVLLNPGGDWSAEGWDFDHFVPQHATQFAQRIRDRFQARKTDYLLPVAVSVAARLSPGSTLVQEADVLIASGEALASDPRSVERPMLMVSSAAEGCGSSAQRYAGCLPEPAAVVK